MQTLHPHHLRASTLDALHRHQQLPGASQRLQRFAWIAFYIVLALLFATVITVGLMHQPQTGEALPPPPPGAR